MMLRCRGISVASLAREFHAKRYLRRAWRLSMASAMCSNVDATGAQLMLAVYVLLMVPRLRRAWQRPRRVLGARAQKRLRLCCPAVLVRSQQQAARREIAVVVFMEAAYLYQFWVCAASYLPGALHAMDRVVLAGACVVVEVVKHRGMWMRRSSADARSRPWRRRRPQERRHRW